MKFTHAIVLFLMVTLVGCVPESDDPSSPEPTDTVTSDDTTSTSTSRRAAALEAAVPADGEAVTGEFLFGAIVDGTDAAEVRFYVDGRELAVVNEPPYQLSFDACELSHGNHAYIVEVADARGNRDHLEQWFSVEGCD